MSVHVILGDVHLGKGLNIGKPASGKAVNSRLQDQLNLLDWTLDQAINCGAESIVITGDVYEDTRPHHTLIKLFLVWIKKCEKERVHVDIIAGNHDISRSGVYTISALDIVPALELPSALTHKEVSTSHHDGVSITFVPYRDRRMYDRGSNKDAKELLYEEFSDEYKKVPEGNLKVLVGHLAFEGSIWIGDEVDDSNNELFCSGSMFSNWDYVWMGHIHKPQVMPSPNNHTRLAHIGSMDRSDFSKSELSHDKIIIIFDSSKDIPFKEVIIPTRQMDRIDIDVTPDKDTDEFIINQLFLYNKEKSIENSIIQLNVNLHGMDVDNADRNRIQKYLQEVSKVHHVAHFTESRLISTEPTERQTIFDSEMGIKATVKTYAESKLLDVETDDERSLFIEFVNECIDEYEAIQERKK